MTKKSLEELEQFLNESVYSSGVFPNSVWQHYKGNFYKITGLSIDCNTNEVLVSYINISPPCTFDSTTITFTRKLSEWFSIIDDKIRFVRVNEYLVFMTKEEHNNFYNKDKK